MRWRATYALRGCPGKNAASSSKSSTIFENYSLQNGDSTAINNFAALVDARKMPSAGNVQGLFFIPSRNPLLVTRGQWLFLCARALVRLHARIVPALAFRYTILETYTQTHRSLPSIISRILINRSRCFK